MSYMRFFLLGTGLAAAAISPTSAATSWALAQPQDERVVAAADEGLVATIPLGFRNGWFTIEGTSSRGPLRLVFDTGANADGLTRAVARHLDLPRVGWTRLHGGSGSESAWLVRGPDIYFGNASARRSERVIVDDDFVTDPVGIRYDGVIGTHLFEHYDVRIDGPRREIRLYEPGRAARGEDLGPPIPMDDLGRALVHFTVRVNGREMGAILDTGAPYTVLNTAAALLAGVELTGEPFTLLPRGIGSATIAAAPIRLAALDLGATRFAEVDAVVAELAMFEALDFSSRPMIILGAPVVEACEILISRARGSVSVCERPGRMTQPLPLVATHQVSSR